MCCVFMAAGAGIEPAHFRLQKPAPYRLGYPAMFLGAGGETRTRTKRLKGPLLCLSSYAGVMAPGQRIELCSHVSKTRVFPLDDPGSFGLAGAI